MVTGVDFVCVPSADFDSALQFYGEALGIEFSPNSVPVALQVDDVAAARAELESRGVSFSGETIDSGVCHMANFRDPEGNALMLHHRYAPFTQPAARRGGAQAMDSA